MVVNLTSVDGYQSVAKHTAANRIVQCDRGRRIGINVGTTTAAVHLATHNTTANTHFVFRNLAVSLR